MADQVVQVPPDSTGKNIATYEKSEGGKTVQVQKVALAGHAADDEISPIAGRLPVDGSGVTQPVSAAALPLPAGAATETTAASLAKEAGGNLEAIAAALNDPLTRQNEILLAILRELRTLRLGFSRDLRDMPGDDDDDPDLTDLI